MSRSRRKTPKVGLSTAASEKDDKAIAHRRTHHAVKQALATTDDPDAMPAEPEHPRSGGWTFSKDGRQWIGRRHPKLMRK